MQSTVGVMIDHASARNKRILVTIANLLVAVPCLVLFSAQISSFLFLLLLLCAICLGEALAFPALYAIVRGVVGMKGWENAVTNSEQFNHLGKYISHP